MSDNRPDDGTDEHRRAEIFRAQASKALDGATRRDVEVENVYENPVNTNCVRAYSFVDLTKCVRLQYNYAVDDPHYQVIPVDGEGNEKTDECFVTEDWHAAVDAAVSEIRRGELTEKLTEEQQEDESDVEIVDERRDPAGHRVVTLDVDGTEIKVRGSEVEIWPVDFDNEGDSR